MAEEIKEIVSDSEEKNVVIDKHGILCRDYDPFEQDYSPRQLKILNHGIYMTTDNWENVEAALGEIAYIHPETGEEVTDYGLIAKFLIAPLIMTGNIGVYNENGTIKLNENGFNLVYTGTGDSDTVFKIQKRNGDGTIVDIIYFDSNGRAHFAGALDAATGTFSGALNAATGTFSGALNAATGTFAGALSAATGTFSGALNAATGTFAGELSASCLKGGTLTLGGANNVNGILRILNASGTEIVSGNQNGLNITSGSISLSNASGTSSNSIAIGSTFAEPFKAIYTADAYGTIITAISSGGFSTESQRTGGKTYIRGGILEMVGSNNANLQLYPNGIFLNDGNGHYWLYISGDSSGATFEFSGNFRVTGSKNRIVETDQYGRRLMYCYETPSPMFGDVGEGTISEDGKCYIYLDPVFAQTIADTQYQVFLQAYGDGSCYVAERHAGYFVIAGTPGISFGWELKAKQKGYDQIRLDDADGAYSPEQFDYGGDAAKHIQAIQEERIGA